MKRALRLTMAAGALVALLVGASPALAAADGAAYGACIAEHAMAEGGFRGDHNPGMHLGFAGWTDCPHA